MAAKKKEKVPKGKPGVAIEAKRRRRQLPEQSPHEPDYHGDFTKWGNYEDYRASGFGADAAAKDAVRQARKKGFGGMEKEAATVGLNPRDRYDQKYAEAAAEAAENLPKNEGK